MVHGLFPQFAMYRSIQALQQITAPQQLTCLMKTTKITLKVNTQTHQQHDNSLHMTHVFTCGTLTCGYLSQ